MRLLHTRADRSAAALVAEIPQPSSEEIQHRMAGNPLPLRHVSPNRGGDRLVARLIKSEKEVEGRYEEVWTLVEEDALAQWPAGPGAVVGKRRAARRRLREGPRGGALHG